jgi:hypothetical protein
MRYGSVGKSGIYGNGGSATYRFKRTLEGSNPTLTAITNQQLTTAFGQWM